MSNSTPAPTNPTNETTEEWRDIPGFSYYQASSFGRVRSVPRLITQRNGHPQRFSGKILKTLPTRRMRYATVSLSRDRKLFCGTLVHHLIALTFLGPRPSGHDIHHLDGNIENNMASNLMYVKQDEHRRQHSSGTKNPMSKLSQQDVDLIRWYLLHTSLFQREIGALFGVAQTCVSKIKRGVRWQFTHDYPE